MNRTLLRRALGGIAFAFFFFVEAALQASSINIQTGDSDIPALDPGYRGRWEVQKGEWAFENGELAGSGDSAINFKGPFEPPFTLSFRLNVIKGRRVRVTVGSVTLANEGDGRALQLAAHGAHFDPQLQHFEYELNHGYRVIMEVGNERVAVFIDGVEELSTTRAAGSVPAITFRAGDSSSKGEVRFGGIVISPSEPPAPPLMAVSGADSEMVQRCSGSLVFIEGSNGEGSGFVATLKGQTRIFTNLHVLARVKNAEATLLDRSPLVMGAGEAAVGHDVGSLAISPPFKALKCMDAIEKNASIGDEVVVLGNAEGARVINPIPGKLVGIGPNLVEVDSPFLPGNSGSPIIHLRTGKVIGIATYATVRKMSVLTSGSNIKRVRRFGYRLDSIEQWQPVVAVSR